MGLAAPRAGGTRAALRASKVWLPEEGRDDEGPCSGTGRIAAAAAARGLLGGEPAAAGPRRQPSRPLQRSARRLAALPAVYALRHQQRARRRPLVHGLAA